MNRLTAILLFLAAPALAADLCVSVAGLGTADGSDWNNSLAAGFTPVRGNTYFLADGDYGAKTFSTAANINSLITIKKATVSAHGPATGWSDALGDGAATFQTLTISTDDWLIDGVTGGGPSGWNTGFGIVVTHTTTPLVRLSGTVDNITLQHVKMDSDRGATTDPAGTTGVGFGGGIKGTTGACSNITVSYCAVTEVYGPCFHMASWTTSVVEYCYMFDNRSTAAYHSEGVSSIGTNTDCTWRHCIWDSIEGTAVFAGVNFGSSVNWQIYGNVFSRSTTPIYYYWEDPGTNQNSMTDSEIHNNTILNGPTVSQGAFVIQQGTGNTSYNNLFYNNDANSFAQSPTHDYSFAADNIRSEGGPFDKDSQILTGETHGQNSTGSPFISYNTDPLLANLQATTNAGMTLAGPFNVDAYGVTRGSGGTWTRGAYQYQSYDATHRQKTRAGRVRDLLR